MRRDNLITVRCLCALLLGAALPVLAQQPTPSAAAESKAAQKPAMDDVAMLNSELESLRDTSEGTSLDKGIRGIVPVQKGFNFSLTMARQHDSTNSWSTLLSPNLAYRFSRHFSANVGLPVYGTLNVAQNIVNKSGKVTGTEYSTKHFLIGDTNLNLGFDAQNRLFSYNFTGTMGIPTGDSSVALGAGQFTYAVLNHFEHEFSWFSTDLELGVTDTPSLINLRVKNSYISVGENAHFQTGVALFLPLRATFEAQAYEDLPLTLQTVTSTTTKNNKPVTKTTQESLGEDNGFTSTLDVPLAPHFTLSGYYNRSLRNKVDVAGFALTFLLRDPPREQSDRPATEP